MRSTVTAALALTAVIATAIAPRLLAEGPDLVAGPTTPAPAALAAPPIVADSTLPNLTEAPELRVRLDRSTAMANGTVRAELTLLAPTQEGETVDIPADVVLVLDRSGSMGGVKMAEAKRAALALIGQLGDQDRVALVSFAGGATVDVPLGSVNAHTTAAIHRLSPGGGTAMHTGLDTAFSQVAEPVSGRARRMILLSDGRPNQVPGLMDRATRAAHLEAPLTTVGIGDDYDPQLLQQLADLGTGNHYWATPATPLDAVFAAEFDASRTAVTGQTRLTWTGAPGVRLVDFGGLPMEASTVQLGSLFSGQRRSIWVTLQLDAERTADDLDLGSFQVDWTDLAGASGRQLAAAGSVAITRKPDVVARNLDAAQWEKSVVQDEYNQVLGSVTEAVAKGNSAAAVQQLQAYRARNTSLNAYVQSQAVIDNLAAVDQLEADLAANKVHKKGLLDLSTQAYQGRRGGSSRGKFGAYGSVSPRP